MEATYEGFPIKNGRKTATGTSSQDVKLCNPPHNSANAYESKKNGHETFLFALISITFVS